MNTRSKWVTAFMLAGMIPLFGQGAQNPADKPTDKPSQQLVLQPQEEPRLTNYELGPGDEIVIYALDAEEISNKPVRISSSSEINLPLVGRIKVEKMTVQALEEEIARRLKAYIQQPQISINVTQFRSQPVSVFGYVGTPGVHQLEGRKTLIEVLSMAGGLKQDSGSKVKITRKPEWGSIPLPGATTDSNGFSVAEVSLKDIMQAQHPELNIRVLPYDVITVPRAEVVFVMGEVKKPGGYALNDRESISVLQALALAEGLGSTSAADQSRIIRNSGGSDRLEIPINIKLILSGKKEDVPLRPDDILFIPTSYAKGAFRRAMETAIQMSTGMVIYRRY